MRTLSHVRLNYNISCSRLKLIHATIMFSKAHTTFMLIYFTDFDKT